MKREIEFRGFIRNNNYEEKVVVNGEVFRGYWCYWNEFGVVVAEENCKDIYLNEHCCYYGMVERNRVIPETVGQYVGIKDKNGKKVYVGDIVEEGDKIGVVKFGEGTFDSGFYRYMGFYYEQESGKIDQNSIYDIDEDWAKIEVIGNIFDKESDNGD